MANGGLTLDTALRRSSSARVQYSPDGALNRAQPRRGFVWREYSPASLAHAGVERRSGYRDGVGNQGQRAAFGSRTGWLASLGGRNGGSIIVNYLRCGVRSVAALPATAPGVWQVRDGKQAAYAAAGAANPRELADLRATASAVGPRRGAIEGQANGDGRAATALVGPCAYGPRGQQTRDLRVQQRLWVADGSEVTRHVRIRAGGKDAKHIVADDGIARCKVRIRNGDVSPVSRTE